MDDSSQNNPGVQQKPTTETAKDNQQYLDSAYPVSEPPKRRKKLIIIAVGVLLLLIVALAALIIQNKLNQRTVACANKECFNSRFKQCLPATYTDSESGSSVKYTINGNQGIGCSVNVEYLKAQYSPDVVGEKMTCDLDNGLDFQTALQNVFHFPADYGCKGNLASLFQSLNDTSNSFD